MTKIPDQVKTQPDLRPLIAVCRRECPKAEYTLRLMWRSRRYRGPVAGTCWPTMAGMAHRLGRAPSTVCEHIRLLEAAGLVTVLAAGGQERPNLYLLRGYARPNDDALAVELCDAWRLDARDAPGVLDVALATTAHRFHRRRSHPTPRMVRTCAARIEHRRQSGPQPGDSGPLRPRKSAQGRARKSACNPALPGHVSTRDANAPPRWVVDPSPPRPAWTDADRRRWRERTATDRTITRGTYGRLSAGLSTWDRGAALVALRDDLAAFDAGRALTGPAGRKDGAQ